ncbi:hypothetical protein GGR03_000667 [Aurantimonas endophytica]|uniref:Uncharacterized protein n=1 Tax=Aurantimonas endophytica TaxID=1522175 RepID=A0A7W6MN67_9HYPH|nr:hypothetical protein [Aurantimonas endophytica]
MELAKQVLRVSVVGLSAVMLCGCVAETGYYSGSYSVIYEEPIYAEPVYVIDDWPRYRPREHYRHRAWHPHHRERWDRGYRYRDRYY